VHLTAGVLVDLNTDVEYSEEYFWHVDLSSRSWKQDFPLSGMYDKSDVGP
jgi:hypothetical protein